MDSCDLEFLFFLFSFLKRMAVILSETFKMMARNQVPANLLP